MWECCSCKEKLIFQQEIFGSECNKEKIKDAKIKEILPSQSQMFCQTLSLALSTIWSFISAVLWLNWTNKPALERVEYIRVEK